MYADLRVNITFFAIITMHFRRQAGRYSHEQQLYGCTYFSTSSAQNQYFLRPSHNMDKTKEVIKNQHKSTQIDTTLCLQQHSTHKLSLKREKDKTSLRNSQKLLPSMLPDFVKQSTTLHPQSQKQIIILPQYQSIPVHFECKHPTQQPLCQMKKPLQSPQRISAPLYLPPAVNFIHPNTAVTPKAVSNEPILPQSLNSEPTLKMCPSFPTTMIPSKSDNNLHSKIEKRSSFESSEAILNDHPYLQPFEDDDFDLYFQKHFGQVQSGQICQNHNSSSQKQQSHNKTTKSLIKSNQTFKHFETGKSHLSQSSKSQSIAIRRLKENKQILQKMDDVQEIKSQIDQEECLSDEDDKQSVVLGRLNQYASLVDPHSTDQNIFQTDMLSKLASNVLVSAIVRPVNFKL